MKIASLACAVVVAAATNAYGQGHSGHGDHSGHTAAQPPAATPAPPASAPTSPAPAPQPEEATTPPSDGPVGTAPPPPVPADHAADGAFDAGAMARARQILRQEHGGEPQWMILANLAEYQFRDGDNGFRWEGSFWIGGDINRFVVTTEGETEGGDVETAEVQALYSRAISPFFNLNAGIRHSFEPRPSRTDATIGVSGVAPYWFDVDAALFLSNQGELSARVEVGYDFRLTQRLILQPQAEVIAFATSVPERLVGSGLSTAELGLRLRYDIRREFSPYVGVVYETALGSTADLRRGAGEETSSTAVVVGVRAWF